MARRSLYLPDELEARVNARAELEGRSFSNCVQWCVMQALGSAQETSPPRVDHAARQKRAPSPVPTRGPAPIFNRVQSLGHGAKPIPKRGK